MKTAKEASIRPALRFPEFLGTGDWCLKPLKDMAEPIYDRAGAASCIPMSITTGVGLVSQEHKFGRIIAGDSYKNYIRIRTNDFAYNKSATKEFPQGYLARYSGMEDGAVPNSIFTCFRADSTSVIPEYLEQLFNGNHHGRWLRKYITVGARANGALSVSDDDLLSLPVPVPPSVDEQQKIAACLNSLDELISLEANELEVVQKHKQALMQRLFPGLGETVPKLRFPEFRNAGGWKHEKLDDLASRGTGHTPNKAVPEYYNGGIKWVSLADSKRLDRGTISETAVKISEKGIRHSSAVLHPAGSVILSRDAGVGKSAILSSSMAVNLLGLEALVCMAVAADCNQFTDSTPACRVALAIEHEIDSFGRLRPHEGVVEIGLGTQGKVGETIQGVPRRLCMDG